MRCPSKSNSHARRRRVKVVLWALLQLDLGVQIDKIEATKERLQLLLARVARLARGNGFGSKG